METTNNTQTSCHGFWKVFLCALLIGIFGGHRFVVGKVRSGLLQLVTFGGLGIWAFIDVVMILLGKFSDSKRLAIPNSNPRASWALFALVVVVGLANDSKDKGASKASKIVEPKIVEPKVKADAFKLGEYSRIDGARVSSFKFEEDLSCYSELNTDFGYIEKWGTWTLGEKTIVIRWERLKSQNVVGPKPVLGGDVEAVQSLEFGRDTVSVGITTYYAKSTRPVPPELFERLKNLRTSEATQSKANMSKEEDNAISTTQAKIGDRFGAEKWLIARITSNTGSKIVGRISWFGASQTPPLMPFNGMMSTATGDVVQFSGYLTVKNGEWELLEFKVGR